MSVLDRKLFRDLLRLWAQALALALVLGGGVATLLLAVGSWRSLEETRIAYYERQLFADVFASASRAPRGLIDRIAEIPGVGGVEARIAELAVLDIEGFAEPVIGRFLSIPETGDAAVNRPYLRTGRLPEPGAADEVLVSDSFARAQGLRPGSEFSAVLNGRKRGLRVVGTALSPEFIYAVGPGQIMPDDLRFGVIWMREATLAAIFDLEGAFSDVGLRLMRGANEAAVIDRLDALLDRYGGSAAYGRRDQPSNAFLEHGLDMLRTMSVTLPPVFLAVAVFLVNLILGRLVTLEREQVGLLKALGYGNAAIAGHYLKFVTVIAVAGTAIGIVAGTLLGRYVTGIYAEFFRFPILVFSDSPDLYLLAALLALAAAGLGAAGAIARITRLAPAVAMQPPAPPKYRRVLPAGFAGFRSLPPPVIMSVRTMLNHPLRTGLTVLGLGLGTGILFVSLFMEDAMEYLIEVKYFQAERQDATLSFAAARPADALFEAARLPGVIAAEPFRRVPIRIRSGSIERRTAIRGRPEGTRLTRIVGPGLAPVEPPASGVAISEWLGGVLGVGPGDRVEIDLLEGRRRTVTLPVTTLVQDFFGLDVTMELGALSRLMREAPSVTDIDIGIDPAGLDALYREVKQTPAIASIALQDVALANFRAAVVIIVTTMSGIYTGLAAVIAFGVVYNNVRIALSERARELASLRILGFGKGEVYWILVLELAIVSLLAQPVGWGAGYLLAWITKLGMDEDLMRVPLVLEPRSFATASAIVLAAAALSSYLVRRRIGRLDLVAVMKTRE